MFGFFSRTIDHRDAYIIHGLHVNLFNWNWCIEKDPFAKRAPLENAHHNMNVHYKNGSHQMNKYHQVHEHQYCIYYSKDVFSIEKKAVGRPFRLKWNSIPTVSWRNRLCIKHILNIHHAWYEIVLHFFITTIPNSINWFKWNFRFWFLFANCNEKIEFRNVSNLRVFLNIF